ncbi:MAG TPA: response regulator transcription factor [Gaiellaceae bacterium]|nr:response regulator transcription factor [Gaiellaceae bacterium]
MTDTAITCVVADDHPPIRDAVGRALAEAGIEVVGEASTGEEALQLIEARRPSVALLDIRLGRGLTGLEVARRMRRSAPETAAVLYTSFGERAMLTEALDAGARGYVLKGAPLDELVRALRLVADGGTYVDGALASALATPGAIDRAEALTARERDVLRLLAEGMRNEQIARTLYISPETVKAHVAKAMRKLEADTRTQAVAEALRRSIIT